MGRYSQETLQRMSESAKRRMIERPWTSPIGPDGPWNKGKKGLHLSPSSEFKKGSTPKGARIFKTRGVSFKGSPSEYKALHYRVSKKFGKPSTCEHCKTRGLSGRKIHWANVSGNYVEDRSDWIRLCAKCHYVFDGHDERKVIST